METCSLKTLQIMPRNLIKDIVQPKKRGVKRGTIRTIMISHTIADIFLGALKGLIFWFKLQKTIFSV